ncbi:hypothetical protein B0T22DRAFT_507275 [Podospora appendiculata]|uniref:Peptidase M3A/M3B catalytic domain-containing protein n=1 Tax=Podospora appendiculata TaxID=314037 RepID=A0AAE1CHD7_9PEZI|nr:hypothetical protein B0T22DRAFT_507275 [Podospora appendiculata]
MATPPKPHFRMFCADEIPLLAQKNIQKYQDMHDKLIRTVTPSTATALNVMLPWVEVENEMDAEMTAINFQGTVAGPDQALKDAVKAAREVVNAASVEWRKRQELYYLMKAVRDLNEPLEPEPKNWLTGKLNDYQPKTDDSDNADPMKQLSSLRKSREKFMDEAFVESGGLWLTDEELDGVPPETQLSKMSRDELGQEPPNVGKTFVRLDIGAHDVYCSAKNPETRRKVYLANEARLSHLAQTAKEIIVQQDLHARAWGKSNYAAMEVAWQLAPSLAWAKDFLDHLKEALVSRGQVLLEVLKLRRALDLGFKLQEVQAQKIKMWDWYYYRDMIKGELQMDQARLAPYFPLKHVLSTLLDAMGRLYRLRFDAIAPESLDARSIWHKDVRVWSVWDEQNDAPTFRGFLYLDLFWRKDKINTIYATRIHPGYDKPDGLRKPISVAVMCNFSSDETAELRFFDLNALTHGNPKNAKSNLLCKLTNILLNRKELGHALHFLVVRNKFVDGVYFPMDFVEAPSQLLERWLCTKEVLKLVGCHYAHFDAAGLKRWQEKNPGVSIPGKDIPDAVLDRFLASSKFNSLTSNMGSITGSLMDMKMTSLDSHEAVQKLDLQKEWYGIEEEIYGVDTSASRKNGHDYLHNWNIFGGSHNGRGYSHILGRTMASVLFQGSFAANPLDQDAWDKYRLTILEPFGSHRKDYIKMVEDYLGRPFNAKALVEDFTADTLEVLREKYTKQLREKKGKAT